MDVNFDRPAMYQLFSESQGIIHVVIAVMKPFLKCFGVEVENGLSFFLQGICIKGGTQACVEVIFSKEQ